MPDARPYADVPMRRAISLALRLAWRADRFRTAARLGLAVVDSVAFALESLGLKLLIDAVVRGDGRGAASAVAFLVVCHGTGIVGDWLGFMSGMRLREAVVAEIDVRLIELTAGAPGIEHLERPDYADELLLLRAERELFTTILDSMSRNVAVFGSAATTIALLATIHPALALLPLFGLPAIYTGSRATKALQAGSDDTAEPLRVRNFTFGLATKAAAAKELRVFGLGPELTRRYDESIEAVRRLSVRARLRTTAWTTAGWLVFAVGYGAAIVFVAVRAVNHQATLGQLALALTLAGRVNGQVTSAVETVDWFLNSVRGGRRLVWFSDYTATRRRALQPDDPAPVPDRLVGGITIEGITFTYPGTDRPVFTEPGVSLHLPAGSTVAVVGDNGAGKTTLVKLLSRFYEPTGGRILVDGVDGVDLRRLPIDQWRQRLSAGFQDYTRYELLARETVGVGDMARIADGARIDEALRRAAATDVADDLPDGLDSLLGKSFDGGVELSGGQWQKLALGRAMMRDAPLLLILDEPTAAIDAQTEHRLFERFTAAAHRAGEGAGAVTIIVSHRFSTVRMADLIVVVSDGGIAEAGTHAELMDRHGTYAELYGMQSAAYQ